LYRLSYPQQIMLASVSLSKGAVPIVSCSSSSDR
jgi:hypothetical protein